jgi:hypothetical protein
MQCRSSRHGDHNLQLESQLFRGASTPITVLRLVYLRTHTPHIGRRRSSALRTRSTQVGSVVSLLHHHSYPRRQRHTIKSWGVEKNVPRFDMVASERRDSRELQNGVQKRVSWTHRLPHSPNPNPNASTSKAVTSSKTVTAPKPPFSTENVHFTF